MGYALGGAHTENIQEVKLRVYLKVMNQDFCIGPLYLMDKFMMEWRYVKKRSIFDPSDNFELREVIQPPRIIHHSPRRKGIRGACRLRYPAGIRDRLFFKNMT